MITDRQKLTLEHIEAKGIKTPENIIKFCLKKISQPRRLSYIKSFNAPRVQRRNHSKLYYQQIINHYKTMLLG